MTIRARLTTRADSDRYARHADVDVLLFHAGRAGWPRVPLATGDRSIAGEADWRTCAETASLEELLHLAGHLGLPPRRQDPEP